MRCSKRGDRVRVLAALRRHREARASPCAPVAVCTRQAHRALSSENTEVVVLTVPVGTTPDFEKLFPDLNVIELA